MIKNEIMDYEKKYNEVLKSMRVLYNEMKYLSSPEALAITVTLEDNFPELKESKDEKIRKELISFFEGFYANKNKDKWIAWLEKQGGHKPADKVEPKFKVGDWITNGACIIKIISIDDKYYWHDNDCVGGDIESIDKEYHLWTIQDAKDGDVLEFGDHGRLVVGIASYVNKTTSKVDVYCLLENNNFKMGIYYNLDTIKPHPATKEQRDLLFQKMKKAGYEWDAEKKELKKIEQKHAWSEEDENHVKSMLSTIECCKVQFPNSPAVVEAYNADAEWIKSLKDRVQPQPKQEWSEEDKLHINNIISLLEKARDRFMLESCGQYPAWITDIIWLRKLQSN